MAAHALLSASGSARWMGCAGSVEACKGYPETTSPAAEEGTIAHEMAEKHLRNGTNPTEADGEMGEYVQIYLDYARALPGEHFIETRVDFSDYVPEGFGTSDFISLDIPNKTLYICDLKYGKGVQVYAKGNSQMQLYALGALEAFSHFAEIETVVMVICQPRRDWIDEWSISLLDLFKFGEYAKQKAEEALTPNAPRTPSEYACQWCPHQARCPELYQLTLKTLGSEFDEMNPPDSLSDEQLAYALSNQKLIASWFSAIEEVVRERLESNEGFPGYKLVAGRSNREWINPEQAAIALAGTYSEDQIFEKSFLSPAKAEKLVGKKNLALIEPLITKKSGKPTLVPESDPRPALNVSADDFDA